MTDFSPQAPLVVLVTTIRYLYINNYVPGMPPIHIQDSCSRNPLPANLWQLIIIIFIADHHHHIQPVCSCKPPLTLIQMIVFIIIIIITIIVIMITIIVIMIISNLSVFASLS